MRRFLRTPSGWLALVLVECAALLVLGEGLIRVFPYRSAGISETILGCAIVLVIGNYVLRRRYLR